MRVTFLITLLFLATCCARSDESSFGEAIPWQEPFEAISANKTTDALVLVLITNEDPFQTQESSRRFATRADAGNTKDQPPVWCADVMSLALRRTLDRRDDLRGRVTIQSIAAGFPKELSGGESRNAPSRAIVALCDGNYRLLGFTVGVPDAIELLTLIEDGQEVATLRQLHADQSAEIVHAIAQRSRERLSRLWRTALDEMLVAMDPGRGDDAEDGADPPVQGRLRLLSETFEPLYLADVQLRFAMTEMNDQTRLVILEQHPQARRPWCEAMIPFTAGSDFSVIWPELVESIWGQPPITADADVKDLLDWYDLQIKAGAVVLSVQAPVHLRRLPWPPVAAADQRGVGWQQVHALALKHPFRTVDPQQLALLIRSRDLFAVNLQQPSTARYLLLEPGKQQPLVAHEGDSPGRFAGRLKRSNSNPVNE